MKRDGLFIIGSVIRKTGERARLNYIVTQSFSGAEHSPLNTDDNFSPEIVLCSARSILIPTRRLLSKHNVFISANRQRALKTNKSSRRPVLPNWKHVRTTTRVLTRLFSLFGSHFKGTVVIRFEDATFLHHLQYCAQNWRKPFKIF